MDADGAVYEAENIRDAVCDLGIEYAQTADTLHIGALTFWFVDTGSDDGTRGSALHRNCMEGLGSNW